jgi:hypothetical protein
MVYTFYWLFFVSEAAGEMNGLELVVDPVQRLGLAYKEVTVGL